MPKITLIIDHTDHDAIMKALERRKTYRANGEIILPDVDPEMEANIEGRLVAEICRGWMELLDSALERNEGQGGYEDEG